MTASDMARLSDLASFNNTYSGMVLFKMDWAHLSQLENRPENLLQGIHPMETFSQWWFLFSFDSRYVKIRKPNQNCIKYNSSVFLCMDL